MFFSGDFWQLEPVGENKKPEYEQECPIFKNSINCFIELKGLHRFKQDLEWGKLLYRFQNGEVIEEDIDNINSQVVDENTELPSNINMQHIIIEIEMQLIQLYLKIVV